MPSKLSIHKKRTPFLVSLNFIRTQASVIPASGQQTNKQMYGTPFSIVVFRCVPFNKCIRRV
jgi:hypothetical protein